MSSSAWVHDYLCCSDKCGMALQRKLNKLESTAEMIKLKGKEESTRKKIDNLYHTVLKGNDHG